MNASAKKTVGWREWASLPDLGVERIKVKIDTGARTSALHAFNVRPFTKDGEDWVRFNVHPLQRKNTLIRACACRSTDYRWVTNSGGGREKRFVIETNIRIGEDEWPIEVTLTDRDQMGFRMLVGRTAINGRFLVDPSRSYCLKLPAKLKKSKKRRAKQFVTKKSEKRASPEEEE